MTQEFSAVKGDRGALRGALSVANEGTLPRYGDCLLDVR